METKCLQKIVSRGIDALTGCCVISVLCVCVRACVRVCVCACVPLGANGLSVICVCRISWSYALAF